jgi:lysozyme
LTSFAYNVGINAFKNSTLLKMLNAGDNKLMVADQFMIWNKITDKTGKKVVSNGLTNRRKAERELFLK